MLIKIRKIIAFTASLILIIISFGLIKPNFSGDPTVSEYSMHNITFSRNLDDSE
jgi:hypothetical protein